MTLVFFGTSAFGIPALEAFLKSRHKILKIITTPEKPQGRNLKSLPSPVKIWADEKKLSVTEVSGLGGDPIFNELNSLSPDVLVVASFGLMLPKRILGIPKKAPLNIHPSILPKYRGAAPIHWALMNGDAETGVSIIRMTEKLDAGDVALLKKVPIKTDDTIYSLEKTLAELGAALTLEALDQLEKKSLKFRPQTAEGASYARKLKKEDGRIDWKLSAAVLHNKNRALLDWPGTFTFYDKKRIVVSKTSIESGAGFPANAKAGQVVTASAKQGLVVATGNGYLRISELQLEGRKKLPVNEFLSGFAVKPGTFFE